MRRLFAAIIFLVVTAWRPAAAQLYQPRHRPVDVHYRHFATDHFRMIYQHGLPGEARELAALLETTFPSIRASVGLRRDLGMPVVLNRFTDRANAFLTPLPFRQEFDAVPLRGIALSPRFHDWFETAGPHELAHAAHAESGRGFGIGWLLRRMGPDLVRWLNLSGPRGINEGLAVWLESRLRPGAGRLNHSFFEMEFRAAMDSDDPWSLTQMLERPAFTRPLGRFYHGGAHLFQHLEEDGDVPFFRRARSFYYRFPLLGYGPALWYGTGKSPHALGRRMRRAFRSEGAAFLASLGEWTPLRTVATEKGTIHRRPRWLDDNTLLAYARGYHLRPGFYRIDLESGARRLVAAESITEDMMFTLEDGGSSVLYSRYVVDRLEALRVSADVFRLNLASGKTERMTKDARLFAPVGTGEGTWALRNVDRFNEWVRFGESGIPDVVGAVDRTQLLAVEPDPSTRQIAVLANRGGRQGIYRTHLAGGEMAEMEPWIQFAKASIYDMSWSSDGRHLLFTADPGGVANIFVWRRAGDRVYQLTNVPYGALEPALSPDQSTIAFVNYRHERYDVVTAPFDISAAREWPRDKLLGFPVRPAMARGARASGGSAGAVDGEGTYRPLLNMRPRAAYPFLLYQRSTGSEEDVHFGLGGGMGVEWSDPLQYWTAHTNVFYQAESFWGRALVRSGRFLLRPSVELFREPSTVTVRRATEVGVDTLRVGKDEWGIGASVGLPAVLQANVFRTTASGVLGVQYRTERLFGREGETLRAAGRRLTLRPAASLAYRMQANLRDLQPNSGLSLSAVAAVDVWSEGANPSRWLRGDGVLYVPVLRSSSTAVKLFASVLAQNRGGQIDLTRFLPRGYETENVFLDRGTFVKSGLEMTRPLWYVDDGFILPPIYVKVIFAYAFAESLHGEAVGRRTGVGAGLGLRLRLFHNVDLTLRCAPVYRFPSSDWAVTFR